MGEPRTHCKRGHKFNDKTRHWVRRRDGSMTQMCRICNAMRERRRKKRMNTVKERNETPTSTI